jgi:hypothetical protein
MPSEHPIEPLLHPRLKCEQVFMQLADVENHACESAVNLAAL